jgi:RNA polymerase sigma-70 factor, ECF subfamily
MESLSLGLMTMGLVTMDQDRPSDATEVQRGERFMALYSGHQRRLYLYAMTLLPASVDADDVLQEANLVLWRKFEQYEPNTNFFAWACQIIRYEVLKYREKRARAARLLDPDVFEQLAEAAISQVEHLDEFHRRALVDCMERLSAGDRDLMRQRYSEAMEVQRIAASMNRSPNAVSKSLGRIRRLLLDCINNDSTIRERQGDAI